MGLLVQVVKVVNKLLFYKNSFEFIAGYYQCFSLTPGGRGGTCTGYSISLGHFLRFHIFKTIVRNANLKIYLEKKKLGKLF